MKSRTPQLSEVQAARLRRFGVSDAVDIHCHCLPGLDDGPRDDESALALCRQLVQDGITVVVATPHALGQYAVEGRASIVRRACSRLNQLLCQNEIPLSVLPGSDVRIDPRVGELLDADEILTTPDGGRYVLIELPHNATINPRRLVDQLARRGLVPILTHPERNSVMASNRDALDAWLKQGAVIQVTAGSLLGDFGRDAQRAAWQWLAAGQVALVATDAHHIKRRPSRMTSALAAITQRLGEGLAGDVCLRNPLQVLRAGRRDVSSRAILSGSLN